MAWDDLKRSRRSKLLKDGAINNCGYRCLLRPDHPRADKKGYVREHILIAEKALGKPLPRDAVVHHVNRRRRGGPLVICQNNSYHLMLHTRQRALEACGHASWRKCWMCQEWDEVDNMRLGNRSYFHSSCARDYQRKRKEGK
jgi:hypothetical protein